MKKYTIVEKYKLGLELEKAEAVVTKKIINPNFFCHLFHLLTFKQNEIKNIKKLIIITSNKKIS